MAKRGKAGKQPVEEINDFDADTATEFFDRLDEVNDRMKSDAAAGRSDMKVIYEEMVDDLDVTMESAKFLWARHAAERRFKKRAAQMDQVDRKAMERFAGAMTGTPFGDWAKEAADLSAAAEDAKK